YMDLSELLDAGYQASDVVMRVDRDQALMYSEYQPAEISPVTHYRDNIYYIEVTYPDGRVALPISEGQQQCELMLALVYPNYQSGWNAENDYSNIDLLEQVGEYTVTNKIPLYINGILYSGTEPYGTTPTPTEPSTTSTIQEEMLLGDANVDGVVNVSDLVLLNRYLLRKGTLSQKGGKNADMDANNCLNVLDSIYLQRHLLI
ncbi:MAG: dockerin type I repeat-containing protein, partial [Oscillospiraceae bacterium]|nr:dockerin type I repeat-containing protein [Oscillospiraceae bacterium]